MNRLTCCLVWFDVQLCDITIYMVVRYKNVFRRI